MKTWFSESLRHYTGASGANGGGESQSPTTTPDGQGVWKFGPVKFRANFDGGNLLKAQQLKENHFHLWTRADNEGTEHESNHRTWFHFEISVRPGGGGAGR